MPSNLVRILPAGCVSGSAQVVAALDTGANGTVILIHWGNVQLGSGTLAGGLAQITLSRPLATDDILQASVTTQGNLSGPPIRVAGSGVVLGPWISPAEIGVTLPSGDTVNMPASQFKSLYGYLPSSLENPAGLPTLNYPEFAPQPATPIGFDLQIERQGGQTTVSIQNVTSIRGGVLVKWSDQSSYGNNLTRSFTVAATLTVKVRGNQNSEAEAATRDVVITIQTPPPASPIPDPRIEFYCWRDQGSLVQLYVNTAVEIQAMCSPSSTSGWSEGIMYDRARQREVLFQNVPTGPVTITIRVRGETNTAKYVTMNFTKFT